MALNIVSLRGRITSWVSTLGFFITYKASPTLSDGHIYWRGYVTEQEMILTTLRILVIASAGITNVPVLRSVHNTEYICLSCSNQGLFSKKSFTEPLELSSWRSLLNIVSIVVTVKIEELYFTSFAWLLCRHELKAKLTFTSTTRLLTEIKQVI